MAAKGSESLNITLVFGQKKIPVHLDLSTVDHPAEYLTIGHLSDVVVQETGVEPSCQKMIFRGRTLPKAPDDGMGVSLASLGIRNGDRIMLLARKTSGKKENASTSEANNAVGSVDQQDKLEELQALVDKMCSRYDQHREETAHIGELQGLKNSKKSLLLLHEDSMKLLEKIDSTPSQDNEEFRKQRKALVNTIQSRLDQCEKWIDEISNKIKVLEQSGEKQSS